MKKTPDSYINKKRPPISEALRLEGGTIEEATASLIKKGYFTPPPRPWTFGYIERGHGRKNFAVLDKFGDLVTELNNKETAEFIIEAANNFETKLEHKPKKKSK
jgi:hypothetical protein